MTIKNTIIALAALCCMPSLALADETLPNSEDAIEESLNDTPQDESFLGNDKEWSVQEKIMEKVNAKSADNNAKSTYSNAKWKRPDIATIPKFGGYIIGSYKFDDAQLNSNTKKKNFGDGFGLRLIRLYVDGTVMKDFKYRLQLEVNGTPHVKDATIEWVHWKFLQMKVGQFKRCFTYENPYNPWDVGVGDYSQVVKKLSGMGDRCGEVSMGGRDLGFQLQGDLFKSKKDGHYQFHYQAAVYNGQGINRKDEDRMKDFIGTIQWSPVKHLSIGTFGWWGTWDNGKTGDAHKVLDRRRFAISGKYENPDNGWSARAEYVRSFGHKSSDWVNEEVTKLSDPNDPSSPTITTNEWKWSSASLQQRGHGAKADAWYVTVGAPVWRWIKIYGKWDAYRDYMTWDSMHSIYSASLNLQPHKNLMLQLQYNFNDDRTASAPRRYYNQAWAEMYIRF